MKANRTKLGMSSLLLVGIILAGLVLVNLLSVNGFFRIDLTDGRQYTLSKSTKEMLRGLDDVVSVKVYFSKDLPTYLVTLNQAVRDLLDEYQAYGKQNLLVEWEDPLGDPETEQRCRTLGIPQVQLQIFEKDKAQVANAYLGIAVSYEDRSEAIPVVQSLENLEYDLTAAILKAFRKEDKTVGLLVGGPGGPTAESGLARLKEALERQYRVTPIDLANGGPVSGAVSTLVAARPSGLSDQAIFAIDQFVMRGGKLLLLVDPIEIPEGSIQAAPMASGLEDLLAHYGVSLGRNLALDGRSNASAAFSSGFLTFSMPYPYWVKVLPENVNAKNPMVSQLGGIVLPWTQTVAAAPEVPASVRVDTLLFTSQYAWTREGEFDLNPQQRYADAPREPAGRFPLAVAATGTFRSFYADRPAPQPAGADSAAPPPAALPESPETQIVVVGSAAGFLDDMIGQFPTNSVFLENAVDWLTLGDDLIEIRSRGATDRPLREISEHWKSVARFLVVFGVPLLVIFFGLFRYVRLRDRGAAPAPSEEKAA